MEFTKGHGTGNDFVILPDPDGQLELTPGLVAALCDRRRGIGADGVLRVVRAAKHPDAAGLAGEAEWFMDYWNADGSFAEMCGNGARVFVRYLVDAGLVETAEPTGGTLPVATRAGVVRAVVTGETISVEMRRPRVYGTSVATLGELTLPGVAVDCGNPHLVCALPPGIDLADLDLTRAPGFDAEFFPSGVNVEFTVPADAAPPDAALPGGALAGGTPFDGAPPGDTLPGDTLPGGARPGAAGAAGADRHVRMRVYERGSGETLSCGTGACAVAAVARGPVPAGGRDSGVVAVEVPGGRLTVTLDESSCWLAGPAVLVATGEIDRARLADHDGHRAT